MISIRNETPEQKQEKQQRFNTAFEALTYSQRQPLTDIVKMFLDPNGDHDRASELFSARAKFQTPTTQEIIDIYPYIKELEDKEKKQTLATHELVFLGNVYEFGIRKDDKEDKAQPKNLKKAVKYYTDAAEIKKPVTTKNTARSLAFANCASILNNYSVPNAETKRKTKYFFSLAEQCGSDSATYNFSIWLEKSTSPYDRIRGKALIRCAIEFPIKHGGICAAIVNQSLAYKYQQLQANPRHAESIEWFHDWSCRAMSLGNFVLYATTYTLKSYFERFQPRRYIEPSMSPIVDYRIALFSCNNHSYKLTHQELKAVFNQVLQSNSEVFEQESEQDDWERVAPLLDLKDDATTTALNKIFNRRAERIRNIFQNLLLLTQCPRPVCELILMYYFCKEKQAPAFQALMTTRLNSIWAQPKTTQHDAGDAKATPVVAPAPR